MNIDEFNEWIEGLDLQTLTDELKKEIIERVNELCDDEYEKGRTEGIHVAQELIIQEIQKMF